MPDLIFARGELALRRMLDSDADYALLARWLTDERVLAFYEGRDNPFPLERVKEKYAPRVLSQEGVTPCILLYQDRSVGYLQFDPADAEEYHFEGSGVIYALDLFIGEPELWGQGIGTQFVQGLVETLFAEKNAGWVILDPHVNNPRAVRAYEKCGFRKLKRLPQHELHEGQWVDCWLMGVQNPAI